jgi:hypothetical protein
MELSDRGARIVRSSEAGQEPSLATATQTGDGERAAPGAKRQERNRWS